LREAWHVAGEEPESYRLKAEGRALLRSGPRGLGRSFRGFKVEGGKWKDEDELRRRWDMGYGEGMRIKIKIKMK
jgi:hypothetical protein